jgi:hypothetical protein
MERKYNGLKRRLIVAGLAVSALGISGSTAEGRDNYLVRNGSTKTIEYDVVNMIPEPASLLLMGAGSALIFGRRKKIESLKEM